MLLVTNFLLVLPNPEPDFTSDNYMDANHSTKPVQTKTTRGSQRGARSFGFTLNGTGYPSTGYYNDIRTGDINKDNHLDIVFGGENRSGSTHGLYVYTGNSNGVWTQNVVSSSHVYSGVAIADCDNDGKREVFAGYEVKWSSGTPSNGVGAWEWTGSGFTTSGISSPMTSGGVNDIVIKNVTGGQGLDLAIATQSAGIKYYEGSGSSPISWNSKVTNLPTSGEYSNIDVLDFNNDSHPDIAAGSYSSGGVKIYIRNTTANSWTDYSSTLPTAAKSGNMLGITLGDLNNDSHVDIVYGTRDNGMNILLGNSGGTSGTSFTWTTPTGGGLPSSAISGRFTGIQLADVDLDGDLDLLAPKAAPGLHLYLGNGSIKPGSNFGFTEVTGRGLPTTMTFYGSAYLDYDNDGDLDVAGATWGNGIKVYKSNLSDDFDNTPPGAVSNLAITNITTNSITVNWTAPADNGSIPGSGPVQSYDIRYSATNINLGNWAGTTQCTGEPTPATPGTAQGCIITGLSSGALYYICLRSNDERPNISPLSNIVSNSTLGIPDTTLPGKITDLQALNPTNNSINLTWTAPADNGSDSSSGSVVEYDIRYYSTSVTSANWALATNCTSPPTPGTPGSTENYNVTGLQAKTTYYFAIKARDERPNWGLISNSDSDTTLPDPDIIPPGIINDLEAIEPTDTTINLTWTAVGDDATSGTADAYDIRCNTSQITGSNWDLAVKCSNLPTPQISGSTEHYEVTGLMPDTTYYFAIKAADEAISWSGLSNIAINKTLLSKDTTPPGKIDDLTVTDTLTQATEITLTWSAPGDDGTVGTVSGYDIRYNTVKISDSLWDISDQCPDWPTPAPPGNPQEYTVTGLVSDQKYYFAIKAFDERPNFAQLSNIANGTTLESTDNIPPAAVTDLTASALSANTIKLTWSAPGDDGNTGTTTGYDIRYGTSSIDESTWGVANKCSNEPAPQIAGSVENYIVTGIFAGTTYYFALKSFDERPNYASLSNIADAKTYSSDDDTPPAEITDLKVIETTESSATLTWTAVGDDGNTGMATAYDLRYAKAEILQSNWGGGTKVMDIPTPRSAGEGETFLITGLDTDTSYYFAIKAADEKPNWAPISNSPLGRTLGTDLPNLVITLTPTKTTLYSGESLTLNVEVLSKVQQQLVDAAAVEFSSDIPGLVFSQPTGTTSQNGDLDVTVTALTVTSTTQITINVKTTKAGFKTNNSQLIITIEPKLSGQMFNLRITKDDINFSKATIRDGDLVTIIANITNIGLSDATGFSVKFFIDDEQLGQNKTFDGLEANKYKLIVIQWLAKEGNYTLRVEITPVNTNFESDISDNSAEVSFSVIEKAPIVGPDNGDKDRSENAADYTSALIAIVIIILMIIIVLAFIFTKKRRSQKPGSYDDHRMADQENLYNGATGTDAGPVVGWDSAVERSAKPGMPGQTDTYGNTIADTYSQPAYQHGDQAIERLYGQSESDDIDIGFGSRVPAAPTALTASSVAAAPPVYESIESKPEPEPKQDVQYVPCPICQKMIPIYSDPCPQCGRNMNWN